MKFLKKRATRRQRGTTTAFFALGMIPMIGIIGIAIELGNVAVHTKRLQNYVDSKAIAELKERFGTPRNVEHHNFLNGVDPAGGALSIQAVRQEGHWDFNAAPGANPFVATGNLDLLQGRVPAYRFVVDPFEVPLLFGPLFEIPTVDISAEATAFAPRREVVFVIDQSGSMCSPGTQPCTAPPGPIPGSSMDDAKQAAMLAVAAMSNQTIPGDQVAALAFSGQGQVTEMPQAALLPLSNFGTVGLVNGFIGALGAGGGTDITTGLTTAYGYFGNGPPDPEVEKIVILIGDGPDNQFRNSSAPIRANTTLPAFNNNGIQTYSIAFCGGQCSPAIQNYFAGIPPGVGNGTSFAPDSPAQLGLILSRIVAGVPMRLVR